MLAFAVLLLLAGAAALQDEAEFPQHPPPPPPETPTGQCYVCVSLRDMEAAEYVRSHHNLSVESCDQFKPGDSRFIRTCQPPFLGCLTTVKGREITRQCSEDISDECHNLNGVHYCYCLDPLCNDRFQDTSHDLDSLSDDEDFPSFLEGSGNGSGAENDVYSYTPEQTTEHEEKSSAFRAYPLLFIYVWAYMIPAFIQ